MSLRRRSYGTTVARFADFSIWWLNTLLDSGLFHPLPVLSPPTVQGWFLMSMQSFPSLHAMLDVVARKRGEHTAIEDPPDGRISYRDLATLSDRVRDRLVALGVRRGDRVGIYVRKSIDAVAAQFGARKAGAAYVRLE